MGMSFAPLVAAAEPVTHCSPNEQPLFSCSTGKKTVSLCGTPASGTPKALAYRFGVPGKVENEFAAAPGNPNRFHTTVITLAPSAQVGEVWFDRGPVRYVMNSCMGGDCSLTAALSVLKSGKIIAKMACKDDDNLVGEFSSDLVHFGDSPKSIRPGTPLLIVNDDTDNEADKVFAAPGAK